MDQSDDPREIERKIAQASRAASQITNQTTLGRLAGWIDELKQALRRRKEDRRIKEDIRKHAKELWELEGRRAENDRPLHLFVSSQQGRRHA